MADQRRFNIRNLSDCLTHRLRRGRAKKAFFARLVSAHPGAPPYLSVTIRSSPAVLWQGTFAHRLRRPRRKAARVPGLPGTLGTLGVSGRRKGLSQGNSPRTPVLLRTLCSLRTLRSSPAVLWKCPSPIGSAAPGSSPYLSVPIRSSPGCRWARVPRPSAPPEMAVFQKKATICLTFISPCIILVPGQIFYYFFLMQCRIICIMLSRFSLKNPFKASE